MIRFALSKHYSGYRVENKSPKPGARLGAGRLWQQFQRKSWWWCVLMDFILACVIFCTVVLQWAFGECGFLTGWFQNVSHWNLLPSLVDGAGLHFFTASVPWGQGVEHVTIELGLWGLRSGLLSESWGVEVPPSSCAEHSSLSSHQELQICAVKCWGRGEAYGPVLTSCVIKPWLDFSGSPFLISKWDNRKQKSPWDVLLEGWVSRSRLLVSLSDAWTCFLQCVSIQQVNIYLHINLPCCCMQYSIVVLTGLEM